MIERGRGGDGHRLPPSFETLEPGTNLTGGLVLDDLIARQQTVVNYRSELNSVIQPNFF